MRRLLVAVLLSFPLLAQSPEEWDVERRLAERFDEERNAERMAAAIAKHPNMAPSPEEDAPGSRYYFIDGDRDPALFLPHELFEALLGAVDPIEPTRVFAREMYGEKLGDFGWEAASFWTMLEQLSADYARVRYQTQTAAGQVASCRARFDALERAREQFGKKELDAFLYAAVAPFSISRTATTEPDPAASLRRESRGCAPDPNARNPWDWTLEERLAARLVPAERKRRVDRLMATPGTDPKSPRPHDHLEGAIRPELLLPTELVEVFIDAALAPGDERAAEVRADAVDRARGIDLPPGFFPALEKAFKGATAASRERVRMLRTFTVGQVISGDVATRLNRLQQDACRGRWKGVQTLRAAYGTAFDRFLYEVVAPNVRKTIYEVATADSLRHAARGCQ